MAPAENFYLKIGNLQIQSVKLLFAWKEKKLELRIVRDKLLVKILVDIVKSIDDAEPGTLDSQVKNMMKIHLMIHSVNFP